MLKRVIRGCVVRVLNTLYWRENYEWEVIVNENTVEPHDAIALPLPPGVKYGDFIRGM
jgi:hypothetical protein